MAALTPNPLSRPASNRRSEHNAAECCLNFFFSFWSWAQLGTDWPYFNFKVCSLQHRFQHCTAQHCTAQHGTSLHSTARHATARRVTGLHFREGTAWSELTWGPAHSRVTLTHDFFAIEPVTAHDLGLGRVTQPYLNLGQRSPVRTRDHVPYP